MKSLGFYVSLLNVALAISPQFRPYEVRRLVQNPAGIQHRIYGGTEASEGQFPYMVLVLMSLGTSGFSKCSSSLISSEWVLLAAHCLNYPSLRPKDILLIGQKADLSNYIREKIFETSNNAPTDETYWGVQERIAKNFYIHPQYSPQTLEHDVGLIRVRSPFLLGYNLQTIPISTSKITAPKMCTLVGWGLTRGPIFDDQKLNYVENKRVRTTKIGCKYKYTGAFICLEKDGTGICKGDSGGPLVCDGKVWGVASHYVVSDYSENCGDSLEEYYSELYDDLEWIKSVYGGGSVAGTSLKTVLLCLVFLWLSAKR